MEEAENQHNEPEQLRAQQSQPSGIRIEHVGGLGSLGAQIHPPLTSPGLKQNWGRMGPQADDSKASALPFCFFHALGADHDRLRAEFVAWSHGAGPPRLGAGILIPLPQLGLLLLNQQNARESCSSLFSGLLGIFWPPSREIPSVTAPRGATRMEMKQQILYLMNPVDSERGKVY
ncbi:hypothetical protein ASPVEDRAFT_330413 [Aspergillus versicolor CBS 583.65]|uniref:Uncharacterized protein n=1 Tax=Aspergillus versicolor CBS 583.65 TaxID=1036611 RepID=A0A1L9PYW3_ASPVE|nr:uncharacterized protein ASPVEDRAFT_330413 [Aspergillus versicolor CBS 583.65]OJJ06616.1 hypothetical protein ASPVEDRAFT_330413 [Aspergillus versicolor CBS 583.65]